MATIANAGNAADGDCDGTLCGKLCQGIPEVSSVLRLAELWLAMTIEIRAR